MYLNSYSYTSFSEDIQLSSHKQDLTPMKRYHREQISNVFLPFVFDGAVRNRKNVLRATAL